MPELQEAPSRSDILQHANELVTGHRLVDYGPTLDNFTRIGELWLPIMRQWDGMSAVPPSMVGLMLLQLKVARLIVSPKHSDSSADAAGYVALSGELAWQEE